MDDDWTGWFDRPVQDRVLDLLADIMIDLRDLPQFACDRSPISGGSFWLPVYQASIETFFTKARLAAEFFVKMPSRDYTARSFVPNWSPPAAVAERLDRVWLMASKQVVHLSRDRVPTDPDEWRDEDISYGALMRITRDSYRCLTLFADEYVALRGEHSERVQAIVDGVRPLSARQLAALKRAARARGARSHDLWPGPPSLRPRTLRPYHRLG